MPPQVAGLAAARAGGTTVFSDAQGDNLMIELVLPKRVRAVLVTYIARNPLPYVKDAFLIGAPLRHVHDDFRRIMAHDAISFDDVIEVLSPEQAGAALTEALDATPSDAEDPESTGDQWPLVRPLVEFVGRILPTGGAGYDRHGLLIGSEHRAMLEDEDPDPDGAAAESDLPPWVLDDGTDLLEEFLASEQARELEDEDGARRMAMFLLLVAAGTAGDPLAWTDEVSTWIAGEMLPTNPVLSPHEIGQIPAVMPVLIRWAHARTGVDPSVSDTSLARVRPLLEQLPARYADPHYRARRPEEQVQFALEGGDSGDLRYADLALQVGGYDELEALELGPLPAEPLILDEVPGDLRDTLREIDAHLVTGLGRLLEDHDLDEELFGTEMLTACRRLLARIARHDPAPLRRRASTRITAGAIAWIIGRGNELLGHAPAPVRSQDLLAAFELKSSPSQRAESLRRGAALPRSVIGVALADPGLLVSSARKEFLRVCDVLEG